MTVSSGRLNSEITELCVPFAKLPSLVGRSFQGGWFVVDALSLPLFDRAIYTDQNPYPLDASGYPEDLVEGFHLLALLDHLVNPLLRVSDGPCVAWNYGLDQVRFVSPVRASQKIRVKGTIGAVRPKGSGFLILSRCAVEVVFWPEHDRFTMSAAAGLRQRGGALLQGIPLTNGDREHTLGQEPDEAGEPWPVRSDQHFPHLDVPLGGWRVRGDRGQPAARSNLAQGGRRSARRVHRRASRPETPGGRAGRRVHSGFSHVGFEG